MQINRPHQWISQNSLPSSTSNTDRIIIPESEPFLNFDSLSELTFEDKSAVYNSLVALVQAKYPFNDALQERAVRFLNDLEPEWGEQDLAARLVSDLVSSSAGSSSGFIESILTLLSSLHSTVIEAVLSFLTSILVCSPLAVRLRLVESDLIAAVFATVQPRFLQISGNETIFKRLIETITQGVNLALPAFQNDISITKVVDPFNHREMVFQKVLLPSSHFISFLISNRHILEEVLFGSLMTLLSALLRIGPFHLPTLEFVLTSPITTSFSGCFSIVENTHLLWSIFYDSDLLFRDWKALGPEAIQSWDRMMQALFSEGFEDTTEQMVKHDED
ncbi:hypothetical protein BLNAU_10183 [Blattamonas nauphoetae]|uniref:Uncharacterized protein n=1 Tax=Blattamonas nauphoetae TaxID=2049346 RepID=A0ABQ9XTN9_9EUKA|nr:hypothetical protein BLNAU_10183 [Blattamonas nauphoetae]